MKKIKKNPDISVIICSYNHGKWIERCLRSLLHQEFINQEEYEIILVDDKSTDYTKKVLKNFKNENLRFFENKKKSRIAKFDQ